MSALLLKTTYNFNMLERKQIQCSQICIKMSRFG